MNHRFVVVALGLFLLAACYANSALQMASTSPDQSRSNPATNEPRRSSITYWNSEHVFSFAYPVGASITEGAAKPRIVELHDRDSGLRLWIDAYDKDDYYTMKLREELVQNLRGVVKDFDLFAEDTMMEPRLECETCYGSATYSNTLKRRVGGHPAIDFRLSSNGGTERVVVFVRNQFVYEIHSPDAFLRPDGFDETESARYKVMESLLESFVFAEQSLKLQ